MKKKIIICVFLVLIIATVIGTVVSAVDAYHEEMQNEAIDIFEGFAAGMIIVVGAFFVLYECDLFYTVYYFFIKPKTVVKTLLNILSHLSLVIVFTCAYLSEIHAEVIIHEEILYILFAVYVLFRLVYFATSAYHMLKSAE